MNEKCIATWNIIKISLLGRSEITEAFVDQGEGVLILLTIGKTSDGFFKEGSQIL